jgi:hypothetical protein
MMHFDKYIWQRERERERDIWLAWHIATLTRTRSMPPLQRLVTPKKSKALKGEEKARREREFREMVARRRARLKGPGTRVKETGK